MTMLLPAPGPLLPSTVDCTCSRTRVRARRRAGPQHTRPSG
jgi:hypothetical protein